MLRYSPKTRKPRESSGHSLYFREQKPKLRDNVWLPIVANPELSPGLLTLRRSTKTWGKPSAHPFFSHCLQNHLAKNVIKRINHTKKKVLTRRIQVLVLLMHSHEIINHNFFYLLMLYFRLFYYFKRKLLFNSKFSWSLPWKKNLCTLIIISEKLNGKKKMGNINGLFYPSAYLSW